MSGNGPWYYWLVVNLRKRFSASVGSWIKGHKILTFFLSILLLGALFINRPLLHPIALGLRKYFLLLFILFAIAWFITNRIKKAENLGRFVLGALLFVLLGLSILFGKSVYEHIGLYVHYQQIKSGEITELPITNFERIQSFESIGTLVNQEGLSETEDATTPRLVRDSEGKYKFTMSVGPASEYVLQQLSKDQYEIISTPALLAAPDFSAKHRTDITFNIGELLPFSRNFENNVIRSFNFLQFFNLEPAEVSFIERAPGDWIEVVSLVKWEGWFIPRPVFGGVVLIEAGEIQLDYLTRVSLGKGVHIHPDSIASHAYLTGQDLIPIQVSHYTADCFRFQAGFLAPLPGYHEGDIRIPVLPDDMVQQPFVIHFDELNTGSKLYHYYGLEPFQEEKRGLNMSVIVPADGIGRITTMDHAERKDAYIGASAVGFKVKESRKNYDWNLNLPAETRPFIRSLNGENRLFWLSTIVTVTGSDSSKQTFGGSIPDVTITDARTGNVIWLNKELVPQQDQWIGQIQKEMEGYAD